MSWYCASPSAPFYVPFSLINTDHLNAHFSMKTTDIEKLGTDKTTAADALLNWKRIELAFVWALKDTNNQCSTYLLASSTLTMLRTQTGSGSVTNIQVDGLTTTTNPV